MKITSIIPSVLILSLIVPSMSLSSFRKEAKGPKSHSNKNIIGNGDENQILNQQEIISSKRNFQHHNVQENRQLATCTSTQWSYEGSCISSCEAPLIQSTSDRTCTHPCTSSSYYYNTNQYACSLVCESPYVEDTNSNAQVKLCSYGLSYNQRIQMDVMKIVFDVLGYFVAIYLVVSVVIKPGHLTPALYMIFFSIITSFKYIGIKNMTYKLGYIFKTSNENPMTLNFGPGPHGLIDKFPNYIEQLSGDSFYRLGLHSSFVVNAFEIISTFTILILILLLATLVKKIAKWRQKRILYDIFLGIRIGLKWNLLALIFFSNIGNIILFTSIEWRSYPSTLTESATTISLSVGLFFVVIGLAFGIFLPLFLKKRLHVKQLARHSDKFQPSKYESFFEKLEQYQIFYIQLKNIDGEVDTSQYFFFGLMIRVILHFLALAYAGSIPQLQTALITLISLVSISFIASQRPFTLKSCQNIAFLLELCILMYSFTFFICSFLDKNTLLTANGPFIVHIVVYGLFYFMALATIRAACLQISSKKKSKSDSSKSEIFDEEQSVEDDEKSKFRLFIERLAKVFRENTVYDPSEFTRKAIKKNKVVPLVGQQQINLKNKKVDTLESNRDLVQLSIDQDTSKSFNPSTSISSKNRVLSDYHSRVHGNANPRVKSLSSDISSLTIGHLRQQDNSEQRALYQNHPSVVELPLNMVQEKDEGQKSSVSSKILNPHAQQVNGKQKHKNGNMSFESPVDVGTCQDEILELPPTEPNKYNPHIKISDDVGGSPTNVPSHFRKHSGTPPLQDPNGSIEKSPRIDLNFISNADPIGSYTHLRTPSHGQNLVKQRRKSSRMNQEELNKLQKATAGIVNPELEFDNE